MTNNLCDAIEQGQTSGMKLQPNFVEWMMKFPIGWTDLEQKQFLRIESKNWHEVATRFCNVSKVQNRCNRLQGLGNAIVPQIAFEIFKSINSTYEKTNT